MPKFPVFSVKWTVSAATLSSPYQTSTLSSGSSQVTVRSSCGSGGSPTVGKAVSRESLVEQQLRELREEQRRLQEEASRLAQERRKFEVRRISFFLSWISPPLFFYSNAIPDDMLARRNFI